MPAASLQYGENLRNRGETAIMSEYYVAGGIYPDLQGNEHFSLVAPDREKPPLLMTDGVRRYFGALSRHAHLYRVEADYSLSLVAPSTQALGWGIKAPEKVVLDRGSWKSSRRS